MTTWQRLEAGSAERRAVPGDEPLGRARRRCAASSAWSAGSATACFWYALMAVLAVLGGDARRGRGAAHGADRARRRGDVSRPQALDARARARSARTTRIVPYIAPLDEFSFPSGHTLHAVSFTLIALAYFPMLAPLLVPFTLLVALSRIVLGLHYPSDVLAATVIGCGLACSGALARSGLASGGCAAEPQRVG